MRQIGYAVLFLIVVIIVIPFILIKGGEKIKQPGGHEKKAELLNKIKVYIYDEDKVVEMNFNEYLKGVVAAEMPASFEFEALKAQAVVARTYNGHKIQSVQNTGVPLPEHKGADICTNPGHCNAWVSKSKAMDRWGIFSAKKNWSKVSRAVDETTNMILTYQDEAINAVFHSTSSGKTENSEDVWFKSLPYLRSVVSEGEDESPKFASTVEMELDEFKAKLSSSKPEIKFPENQESIIENIENTEGGGVKLIKIGGCDFKGTEIRSIFSLNSANFSIEIKNGKVTFTVHGNGHGVGMSQYGANYMAEQGKNFEEILKHYYQGVEIKELN